VTWVEEWNGSESIEDEEETDFEQKGAGSTFN
jgi:hypothetical protein